MKRKLFATMALFAALALTACGGKGGGDTSNGGGKTSTSKTKTSTSAHVHTFDETKWESNETQHWHPATCEHTTQKGSAANHTFEEVAAESVAATCSTPGKKVEKCSVCGYKKETVISADHTWDAGTPVAGADDEVAYTIFSCTACNKAKKIEFAAKQGEGKSTIDGSLKSDSTYPDYMKLNANGNSVTYKLNIELSGNAVIYQRGVMDYWHDGNNENQARNYYSGKNSSDGNFELKVNDVAVDYSWSRDVTYEDMLPGEYTGSYSPLGDAKIGSCTLKPGVNTIVYKRTESYNMLIKDFVIIIDNPSLVA